MGTAIARALAADCRNGPFRRRCGCRRSEAARPGPAGGRPPRPPARRPPDRWPRRRASRRQALPANRARTLRQTTAIAPHTVLQLAGHGRRHRRDGLIAGLAAGGVAGGHARRAVHQHRQQRFAGRRRNVLQPRRIQQNHQRHGGGEGHQGHHGPPPPRGQPAAARRGVPRQQSRGGQRQRHPQGQRNIRIEGVICVIESFERRRAKTERKCNKAEVSPKMHTTQATANHFQKSSRRLAFVLGAAIGGHPARRQAAGQHFGGNTSDRSLPGESDRGGENSLAVALDPVDARRAGRRPAPLRAHRFVGQLAAAGAFARRLRSSGPGGEAGRRAGFGRQLEPPAARRKRPNRSAGRGRASVRSIRPAAGRRPRFSAGRRPPGRR